MNIRDQLEVENKKNNDSLPRSLLSSESLVSVKENTDRKRK